jgi:hypothetical protein
MMVCRDCARYDGDQGRCRDQKVNPQSWDQAVSVAQVLGLRSICTFNDYRERLVRSRSPVPASGCERSGYTE